MTAYDKLSFLLSVLPILRESSKDEEPASIIITLREEKLLIIRRERPRYKLSFIEKNEEREGKGISSIFESIEEELDKEELFSLLLRITREKSKYTLIYTIYGQIIREKTYQEEKLSSIMEDIEEMRLIEQFETFSSMKLKLGEDVIINY